MYKTWLISDKYQGIDNFNEITYSPNPWLKRPISSAQI